LESAVARPFQSVLGQDAYPTTIEKAAALFHSLVANHPFHDGNKRTAVVAVQHFLIANGFLPTLSNQGFYELAKNTASYRERRVMHSDVLGEICSILTTGTASLAEVRKQIVELRAEIKVDRKHRARVKASFKRSEATESGQARVLKQKYLTLDKELKRAESEHVAALVKIYEVGSEMRLHIRSILDNKAIHRLQSFQPS
jgi:death-on-curing family protein